MRPHEPETPPATGDQRWDRCAGWIAAALAYEDGRRSMADLFTGYRAGRFVLLDAPASAMLFELVQHPAGLVLNILLAGGVMAEVDGLRADAERLAVERGCVAAAAVGRRGWIRAWRRHGYRPAPMIGRWYVAVKDLGQSHGEPRMTAVNVSLDSQSVGIACDTLVTDCRDREFAPISFASKAAYLPHLRMAIVGTGGLMLQLQILAHAQSVRARDVTEITGLTAELCRREFAAYRVQLREVHPPHDQEWIDDATVYLLGWVERARRFVGYRFRARADFRPEPIGAGCYLHPAIPGQEDAGPVSIDRLAGLTRLQWSAELRKLRDDRNAVGGDLCVATLRWRPDRGVVFESWIAERFPTYEADLAEMRARHDAPVREVA